MRLNSAVITISSWWEIWTIIMCFAFNSSKTWILCTQETHWINHTTTMSTHNKCLPSPFHILQPKRCADLWGHELTVLELEFDDERLSPRQTTPGPSPRDSSHTVAVHTCRRMAIVFPEEHKIPLWKICFMENSWGCKHWLICQSAKKWEIYSLGSASIILMWLFFIKIPIMLPLNIKGYFSAIKELFYTRMPLKISWKSTLITPQDIF
jgi:hypothetical protein